MTEKDAQPVSYTNRKGKTYYLHETVRKSGKKGYVMKTALEGALTELPEGYAITESVNGRVSVGMAKPREITEEEEALVAAELERLELMGYRCDVKGPDITVYEPLHNASGIEELAEKFGPMAAAGVKEWMEERVVMGPLDPVMRFSLSDKEKRLFNLQRMTYSGSGGWMHVDSGRPLWYLVNKYMRHLGKESFYEML